MTRDKARQILLRYRPDTPDAEDADVVAALAMAKGDAELAQWLDKQLAQQELVRSKLRQVKAPAGLKEHIVSEQSAHLRGTSRRLMTAMGVLTLLLLAGGWWGDHLLRRTPDDDTFLNYRRRMVGTALRGYAMDLESSDLAKIRAYLTQQKAPDNFEISAALQHATITGCAVESWQGHKVSMICFHTGKPLPDGRQTDLWLFVTEKSAVKNSPAGAQPEFAKENKLQTVTWTHGDKLMLLGASGDEQSVRKWL